MATNLHNRVASAVITSALAASTAFGANDIVSKLARIAPELTVVRAESTPADGILRLEIEEDNVPVYVTADGTHLFTGDMYSLSEDGAVEATVELQMRSPCCRFPRKNAASATHRDRCLIPMRRSGCPRSADGCRLRCDRLHLV